MCSISDLKWWNGDRVDVKTPRGQITLRALVTDNIVKGAVEANMGGGCHVGPKAWQEGNVNELTDLQRYDPISGFPVYKALLCDVAKADGGETVTIQPIAELARIAKKHGVLFHTDATQAIGKIIFDVRELNVKMHNRHMSISPRFEIRNYVTNSFCHELSQDVFTGLTAGQKFIPCKYFYDERGSRLYEQICKLPEYYLTCTELSILQEKRRAKRLWSYLKREIWSNWARARTGKSVSS